MALGAAFIAVAVAANAPTRILLAWTSVSFAIVATAYWSNGPRLLLKRNNGSQPLWSWLALGPHFLLTRISFGLYRLAHPRNPACAEVSPGLSFSRRPTRSEATHIAVQWSGVLDLAAEFPRASIDSDHYLSLPLLDGAVPTSGQLQQALAWIDNKLETGPVLVHCALGHGRTGCVVLAWLLVHHRVSDIDAGIERLRALRSGFGLSKAQSERARLHNL